MVSAVSGAILVKSVYNRIVPVTLKLTALTVSVRLCPVVSRILSHRIPDPSLLSILQWTCDEKLEQAPEVSYTVLLHEDQPTMLEDKTWFSPQAISHLLARLRPDIDEPSGLPYVRLRLLHRDVITLCLHAASKLLRC